MNLKPSNESFEESYNKNMELANHRAIDFNAFTKNRQEIIENNYKGDVDAFERQLRFKSQAISGLLNERVDLLRNGGIKDIGVIVDAKITPEELEKLTSFGLSDSTKETNEEVEKFYLKVVEKAKGLGYEVTRGESERFFILKSKDIDFQIDYNVLPETNGIAGSHPSRIWELMARKKDGELICYFDKVWVKACEDEEVQKEVDTIVATLG